MNTITLERREELATQIEPLRQQAEAWRQSRSGLSEPMPKPLWEAATALAKSYGVSPVQRILRIDYRGLEYRALELPRRAGSAHSFAIGRSRLNDPRPASKPTRPWLQP